MWDPCVSFKALFFLLLPQNIWQQWFSLALHSLLLASGLGVKGLGHNFWKEKTGLLLEVCWNAVSVAVRHAALSWYPPHCFKALVIRKKCMERSELILSYMYL